MSSLGNTHLKGEAGYGQQRSWRRLQAGPPTPGSTLNPKHREASLPQSHWAGVAEDEVSLPRSWLALETAPQQLG